eukprot:COSAG06_NODE_4555_length_4151_cov_8.091807_2_plen_343_part_00
MKVTYSQKAVATYDLVATLHSRRTRWLGHILRMPEERLLRQVVVRRGYNGRHVDGHFVIDDGVHRPGDLFAHAPPHVNMEDLIDQAKDRETWRLHVNAIRPAGERQRIANATRLDDVDDDPDYSATTTRSTAEQQRDRRARYARRYGAAAPPPSPDSATTTDDDGAADSDDSDLTMSPSSTASASPSSRSTSSSSDDGSDNESDSDSSNSAAASNAAGDDEIRHDFVRILSHQYCGHYDQHKFKLLWADGSASFVWECDLQDDSPAAYQRYMTEITAASNQQPTPEPEPEPDPETDSEPEPPPPRSTESKNDDRLQRRLRRAAANGDWCPAHQPDRSRISRT